MSLLREYEKNVIVAKLSTRFYLPVAFCTSLTQTFPQLKDLSADTILSNIFGEKVSEFVTTDLNRITLNRHSDYNSVLKKEPLVLSEEEKDLVKALLGTQHMMMYTFHSHIVQTQARLQDYTGDEILFATFGDKVKDCIVESLSGGGNVGLRLVKNNV